MISHPFAQCFSCRCMSAPGSCSRCFEDSRLRVTHGEFIFQVFTAKISNIMNMKKSVLLLCLSASSLQAGVTYPETVKKPVENVYHGVTVSEFYRWLEEADDEKVQQWILEQNAYTRNYVDDLAHTDAIREAVTRIMTSEEVSYLDVVEAGGVYFALKDQPPAQQAFLVTFADPDHPEEGRVLLDPNRKSDAGAIAIDWFEPSFDGAYVAVSLSSGGSEAGDIHLFDVKTGEQVFEVIPRVNTGTAGGDLAWMPDNSGFFYTRHPREGEKPEADLNFYQQVFYHELGTDPATDRYEMGKGFPRIAENEVEMEPASGQLLLTVQDGDGGQFAHYLRSVDGDWRQFSRFEDGILQATFAGPDYLFVLSREHAPKGKILKVSTQTLEWSESDVIVPECDDTIINSFYRSAPSLLATKHRLYVLYQKGGPSEIRVFDHDGNALAAPEQETVADIDGMEALSGEDILFRSISYTHPRYYYRFAAEKQTTEKLRISTRSSTDFSDVSVTRDFAVSKDGTLVPVNLLIPEKAKGNPRTPFIMYGYGGYGVNMAPRFRETLRVLFDLGFGYAVANIRGGGEYGEAWHQQGMLTRKQNVFDDFAAACEFVLEKGYTDREHLSIMGGSNGGLLMGALLTQHPDLMRAVVSYVGIYDMLRVELSPNGSFNIPEFGTVKDAKQFEALYAYSPYHRVQEDIHYPAVLFLTGANDPRVDPMQSRKMAARLQAANASAYPILLRTSFNAGHGMGTPLSEQIEQTVVVYQFLIHELGVAQQ